MTKEQTTAQVDSSPSRAEKKTQHDRIMDLISENGEISNWGAIHDVRLHCTKLSTRIGEIERQCGHGFARERITWIDEDGKSHHLGTRYTIPRGLTVEDFNAALARNPTGL